MAFFKSILFSITLIIQLPLMAQFHPMLDAFSVFEYQGEVYLNWTIGRGNTCNGILIQRSDNNQFFTEIGDIPGICGSIDSPQSYTWIDRTPLLNHTNYYRLELGSEGPSESVNIEIIALNGKGYQVRPNPISDNGFIYFRNTTGRQHDLVLYDVAGKPITNIQSSDNYFNINVANLPSGLYLFTIKNPESGQAISGKVSVAH